MPVTQLTSYDSSPLKILQGETLVFDKYPLEDDPQYINQSITYTATGHRLLSVRFPNGNNGEARFVESEQALKDYLNTKTFSVENFGDRHVKNISILRPYKKKYIWVRGRIALPGVAEKDQPVERGVYCAADVTDPTLPIYITNKNNTRKIFRLNLIVTSTVDTNGKTVIIEHWNATEITDSIPSAVRKNMTSDSMTIPLSNLGTGDIDGIPVETIKIDNPPISLDYEQRITVKVFTSMMYSGSTPTIANVFSNEDKLINFYILNNGIGVYNENYLGIIEQDTPQLQIDLKNYIIQNIAKKMLETPTPGKNPVQNKLGLWSSVFWNNIRQKITSNIQVLSWTGFSEWYKCPWRFYHHRYKSQAAEAKVSHLIDEDKITSNLWGNDRATILGTITHSHLEELLRHIINDNAGQPASAEVLKEIISSAKLQMRGINLTRLGDGYDFTAEDVQRAGFDQDDFQAIEQMLTNINNRKSIDGNLPLYTSFDEIGTEVQLTENEEALITIDNKPVRIVGAEDAVFKNSSGQYMLMDPKSNQKPFTYTPGNIDDTDFEVFQIIWYLKFFRAKGAFTYQDINFNLSTTADNDITLIFDFMRFKNDESSSRLQIQSSDIAPMSAKLQTELEKMVKMIEDFQKTPNIDPHIIFKTKPGSHCGTCNLISICPNVQHLNSREKLQRNAFLHERILTPPIVTQETKQNIDSDELFVLDNSPLYSDVAIGTNVAGVTSAELREIFEERIKKIKSLDENTDTQIGAIYLTSAITSIQLVDQKRHEVYSTLRSPAPTVLRVEGTDKTAVITIRFDGAEKINSEMRHILAQYIAFPFVSIRNSEITRTLLPFDVNRDVYYNMTPKLQDLVQRYFDVNVDDDESRKDKKSVNSKNNVTDDESPAQIKQKIYKEARLFYGIKGMSIEPVANQVDTVDMTMQIQLHNIIATTSNGTIEYLYDSNAVMNQLAWMYNQQFGKHPGVGTGNVKQKVIDAFMDSNTINPDDDISLTFVNMERLQINHHRIVNNFNAIAGTSLRTFFGSTTGSSLVGNRAQVIDGNLVTLSLSFGAGSSFDSDILMVIQRSGYEPVGLTTHIGKGNAITYYKTKENITIGEDKNIIPISSLAYDGHLVSILRRSSFEGARLADYTIFQTLVVSANTIDKVSPTESLLPIVGTFQSILPEQDAAFVNLFSNCTKIGRAVSMTGIQHLPLIKDNIAIIATKNIRNSLYETLIDLNNVEFTPQTSSWITAIGNAVKATTPGDATTKYISLNGHICRPVLNWYTRGKLNNIATITDKDICRHDDSVIIPDAPISKNPFDMAHSPKATGSLLVRNREKFKRFDKPITQDNLLLYHDEEVSSVVIANSDISTDIIQINCNISNVEIFILHVSTNNPELSVHGVGSLSAVTTDDGKVKLTASSVALKNMTVYVATIKNNINTFSFPVISPTFKAITNVNTGDPVNYFVQAISVDSATLYNEGIQQNINAIGFGPGYNTVVKDIIKTIENNNG